MDCSEIKVLDCTIRDGGLANDSHFPLDTVRAVYRAACLSGIDYVELGYRNSKKMFSTAEYGPWRFCDEDQLQKAVEGIEQRNTKISIMQDAHKAVPGDIIPKTDSVVNMIRIATYVKDIDKAVILANNAVDKGYECTINIMAISREESADIDNTLQKIEEETRVNVVYVVDSYGALFSDNVCLLTGKYKKYLKNKEIGIHLHNHMQLAFANTLEGIKEGATFVDGTLYGLGRAAGNCPTELLIGYLKNPKYDVLPLLDVIQKKIIPLKDDIDWGYHVPYMLSGILNKHPKDATEWMKSPQKDDIVGFYKYIYE